MNKEEMTEKLKTTLLQVESVYEEEDERLECERSAINWLCYAVDNGIEATVDKIAGFAQEVFDKKK